MLPQTIINEITYVFLRIPKISNRMLYAPFWAAMDTALDNVVSPKGWAGAGVGIGMLWGGRDSFN